MKRKHVIVLIVLFVCIFTSILAIKGILSNSHVNLEQLKDLKIENVDLEKMSDGVYSGSYTVFPISVEVKVRVNNHKISGVELVKHSNGQGTPAEKIIDRVLDAQSLEVDIVSGATYSSKIILKAIENALNSAEN